jgi:hypothetical protein
MRVTRRLALTLLALSIAACGGGAWSTLKTVRSATGSGPVDFEVHNGTDVAINSIYVAKTETVSAAIEAKVEPGSAAEEQVWGGDLLERGALQVNDVLKIPVPEPGKWDVRVVDRDGRYQHVAGLKLGPGGKYRLELGDGGWRLPQ